MPCSFLLSTGLSCPVDLMLQQHCLHGSVFLFRYGDPFAVCHRQSKALNRLHIQRVYEIAGMTAKKFAGQPLVNGRQALCALKYLRKHMELCVISDAFHVAFRLA